jgi:hypothetical protein
MDYLNVNWLAVVLAMIASMALGAAWYMGLSKQWLEATGKTIEDIKSGSGGQVTPFIWGAAMQLVMAYFLALLTPMVMGEVTIGNAVILGIHIWAGFMVTAQGDRHNMVKAVQLGVRDYITKPWETGEVELCIKWALNAARKTAEARAAGNLPIARSA